MVQKVRGRFLYNYKDQGKNNYKVWNYWDNQNNIMLKQKTVLLSQSY